MSRTKTKLSVMREIRFLPAFDRRHANPEKDEGVHGVEVFFILTGPEAVLTCVFYTDWQLPQVETFHQALRETGLGGALPKLICADLSVHRPLPFSGDIEQRAACDFLGGVPCYGSRLMGYTSLSTFAETLIAEGSEGLWSRLETIYRTQVAEA